MIKNYILPLLILTMLYSCSSTSDSISSLKAGVSKELAVHRFQNLDNIEYEIHFELPDQKEERIPSSLLIHLTIKDDSEPLILDFKSDSTQLKNLIVNNQQAKYTYEQEHVIIPSEYLEEGENTISFQFTAGDQSLNRKENYMYTLLVPDRARTLFPCFDQPDLKAKYVLSLGMPESWDAIAGEYGETQKTEENRKVITFKKTAPISSYLFSFVAGEFKRITQNVEGRTYSMLHLEEEDKINLNKDAIFELHAKSVSWMEDYTNIPLPFNKLDFALIPPFQYGGMEHVGAIQYRASSLILDENAGPSEELRRAQLIAHEVAHMWFGDLVTMKWFDDVWLKEVFANFMASKMITPSYPEINHKLQFYLSHQYRAYVIDRTAGTHPIQQELANLNLAGTLYGAIIYCKAPVVMAQLELLVGEDKLQEALQNYLKKYEYSNATFDDLINVISETSNQDLKGWADVWVKNSGMPHYKLQRNDDNLSIQTSDYSKTQQIIINNQSVALDKGNIEVKNKKGEFPLDQSAFNYGFFELSKALSDEIIASIDNYTETERAIAYSTLWENFLHKKLDLKSYSDFLIKQFINEDNLLLKKQLLSQYDEIYWYYFSDRERTNYSVNYFYTFKDKIEKSNNKAEQSIFFKGIKLLAHQPNQLSYLKTFLNTNETVPTLNDKERIALYMKLRLEKYCQDSETKNKVKGLLTSDYYKSFFDYILPTTSKNQIVRDNFFEEIKKVDNRGNEPWVESALYYLNHPLNAKSSLKYLRPTLELLPEIQKTGDIFFPYNYLLNSLGKRDEKMVIQWTNEYLEKNKLDIKLKNKVLQNLDPVIRRQRKN